MAGERREEVTGRPLSPPLPLAGERSPSDAFLLLAPRRGERRGEGGNDGS
jgi:hypothetical protein